jgi:hypothetical protein
MKKWNLSVSDLGSRGVDALKYLPRPLLHHNQLLMTFISSLTSLDFQTCPFCHSLRSMSNLC